MAHEALIGVIDRLAAAPPIVRFSAKGIAAQAKALAACRKALAVPPADDWASIGAELSRKATEKAAGVIASVIAGEISAAQGVAAVDALCDLTQGLIPHEDWQCLYLALKELRQL